MLKSNSNIFKRKIKLLFIISTLVVFSLFIFGCGKDKETKKNIDNPAIKYPTNETTKNEVVENEYIPGKTIEVSGTSVLMGEKYTVSAYNEDIEVVDLDFLDYGFGVSLPTTIFNPENVYYLQAQTNGAINITTADADKILLNFMDDIRFTLVSYNYGIFSTWASSYDDLTYYNIKRCTPTDLIPLVEESGFIEYHDGYRIAKYYDMYDQDAYRVEMEVDVYPFKGNTDFSYHGYLTMLCHDGIMRSILFAEPKFDENNPYQMIYPVSRSTYWLDIGTNWDIQPENSIKDDEVEDREVVENQTLETEKDFKDKDKNKNEDIKNDEILDETTTSVEEQNTTITPTPTSSISQGVENNNLQESEEIQQVEKDSFVEEQSLSQNMKENIN